MKKLTTFFKKDPTNLGRVINEVADENKWVIDSGIPTIKKDGTSCAIINGILYKRFDLKKGRTLPIGSIECQDADKITGHHPHWTPCIRGDNGSKYHLEAFDNSKDLTDGTYELLGEKVNGNKENVKGHILYKHGSELANIEDFSFELIKRFLEKADIEGIVFYDKNSDKMCKIRKKDFGIKR